MATLTACMLICIELVYAHRFSQIAAVQGVVCQWSPRQTTSARRLMIPTTEEYNQMSEEDKEAAEKELDEAFDEVNERARERREDSAYGDKEPKEQGKKSHYK